MTYMLQNQIVTRLNSQSPKQALKLTLQFWDVIAAELTPIVGKDGFAMLYTRCIYLGRESYPWLGLDPSLPPSAFPFVALKNSFAQRDIAEAGAASLALFLTFTDLLAVLIGEPLTDGLLRVFWASELEAGRNKELGS